MVLSAGVVVTIGDFTPASIYLHRSLAAPPFILLLPPSFLPRPLLSSCIHPSIFKARFFVSSPALSECDIDSKVAVLLTAASLLNILGSVSVAVCRGKGGELGALLSRSQLLLANRRATTHTCTQATCTHAEMRAHTCHSTDGRAHVPGLYLHMLSMQMSQFLSAFLSSPIFLFFYISWRQTSKVNEWEKRCWRALCRLCIYFRPVESPFSACHPISSLITVWTLFGAKGLRLLFLFKI